MTYTLYELTWLFFVYSVLGWCAGVAVAAVRRREFVNIGILNLPVCPAYGFAAVSFCMFLDELKREPVFLFIGGMVLTAFFAFNAGVVLEHIFHRSFTGCEGKRFRIGRYITIPTLLLGGVGANLAFWLGNPLVLDIVRLIPQKLGKVLLAALICMLLTDLFATLSVVWKWRRYMDRVSGLAENMQNLSTTFGNAIVRAVCRRLERSYPNMKPKAGQNAAGEPAGFGVGLSFYKLAILFVLGSLIGDLVETVFCRFAMGYWMSRSSLVYGPFSVVWGMGIVMLTVFLYGYRDKSDRYIFIYGTVAGGTYEYICSVLAEMVFGASFWNYSKLPFNLGGRINLLYCFFWGIAAVVWLKIIYPFLSDWIEKIPIRIGKILTWLVVVFMVVNMLISAMALMRYSERQQGIAAGNQIEELLDAHFTDTRMERIYPKAKIVDK